MNDTLLRPGDLIAAARKRKGFSARQTSTDAGLSPSYVSKVEAGELEPSLRAFARIARALEFSPAEIYVCVRAAEEAA